MNKLPVYDALLNLEKENSGISAISLVKNPAIQSTFVKLSEEQEEALISFDNDRRIITGAILIPDRLIYRKLPDVGEFYLRFNKETISAMHEQMMKCGTFNSFSLSHNGKSLERYQIIPTEIWIKEYEEDKSTALGFDLPIGTLFMSAKVDDDLIWAGVKSNDFNGFSIETMLDYQYSDLCMEKFLFEAVEVGKKVVHQKNDDICFTFSGETIQDGKVIKIEDGVITQVTDEEKEKTPKTNEDESNSGKNTDTDSSGINKRIDELTERIEKFSKTIEGVVELFTSATSARDEIRDVIGKFAEETKESKAAILKVIENQEALKLSAQQSNETIISNTVKDEVSKASLCKTIKI